jgi:ubiquinone/menaquinone biosynthesis C-methylase UbiE
MDERPPRESRDHGTTLAWYERSYTSQGIKAQRRYPNEELVRFLARNFFQFSREQRARISILDVGCGSCSNLWMIAREGFDAHGVDLSPEAVRLGQQVLAEWDVHAQLKVGDLLQLPYGDQAFDAVADVFASYVLNVAGFKQYLGEVVRVLKPGGRLFLFTPSAESDAFKNYLPAQKLDEFTLNGIYRENSPYGGNFYPFRFSGVPSLRQMLQNVGLQPESVELTSRTYNAMSESFQFITVDARRREI